MTAPLPDLADCPGVWRLELTEAGGERRATFWRVRRDAAGTWHRCHKGADIPLEALAALLEGLRAGVATLGWRRSPRF